MKRKLFIILGTILISISLLFSYIVKDNKEENNKEISKVERILYKPEGIQAYTLYGEKTDVSYNDLIEGYEIDSITCKNGTIATYNKEDNSVSLSNINMPDYCTMDFKLGTYTVTIDAGGGYFGTPAEIDDGFSDTLTLAKGVSVPVHAGNTLNLTPNQKYLLSFDYKSDEGSVEFDVDLYPDSLPQIYPVATTTQQTMNWIFSSSSSDMTSCKIRYFNDMVIPNSYNIYISNMHLYKCDDCRLTYTKEVTKGNAYGSLKAPKRDGYSFLGWYLEDGTKVDSTSINNIKGDHTITAKWAILLYYKILADNTTIKTRTNFSTVYTETNSSTLFKSTESIAGSTAKDVYYFSGNAQNNWVKFAGFYWRVIRTNHDGSVRLLYSGTSPDTTEGYIGTSAFNSEYNSPKYVGYMYGEDDSSLEGIRANTKDSTIKAFIDNWYITNLSSYTKYLSKDAVYCNDRELDSGQSWTYATSSTSQIKFVGYSRIDRDTNGANANPTYNCTNIKDAFSGNNSEAKLTYPIGLITADELEYAGTSTFNALTSPYTWYYNNSNGESIVNDKWWFTMTPMSYKIEDNLVAYVWDVVGNDSVTPGRLGHGRVLANSKIRPVISLKGNLIYKSGNGSSSSPYEVEEQSLTTLYDEILEDNPTIKTRSDFSTTYTETNTGTLFKSTESIAGSIAKDVYYFAGNALNNWVKFGGFYWRIIRTNHDGSIRMLYSGTSPDTTNATIDNVVFNNSGSDPMFVGYMYGTSGTLASNRTNENDSTIKEVIDTWYNNNLSSYTKYLSTEAVYCNDREIGSGTYNIENSTFHYASYTRLYTNKTPTYNCVNSKDAFSGSNSEAKLIYPIGLMTADEISYAGGKYDVNLTSPYSWYYLNSSGTSITGEPFWWLMSPGRWQTGKDHLFRISGSSYPGLLLTDSLLNKHKVRPVISIKSDALYSKGDGSPENPYEIVYN